METISFVTKPNDIKVSASKHRDFSLCPSDYREFKYNYEGTPLDELVVKKKTGQEIGSEVYIKNTKYRFLKTRNITNNYLLDKQFCETCGNVDSIKPFVNSIFIAKDGGGNGLGDIAFYDTDQYDQNDYISSGILNIVPKQEVFYYVLAILKYKHFKNFIDTFTKKGSTIRHSKRLALEYKVPFSGEYNDLINQISTLMKTIADNEIEIRKKFFEVNKIIDSTLLVGDWKSKKANNTINCLKNNNCRMDSGMYSDSFIQLTECLKNYKNGYFTVNLEDIKSGNTPETRVISEKAKYVWVTPTDIQTNGILNFGARITMNTSNNINNDCVLIINRGDKFDVGISMFYDYSFFGEGHHNQGIYRIDCYDKDTLICMSAYLNSDFCRKLCSCLSYGTKMREMKSIDFAKLSFPIFDSEIKTKIVDLYTCETGIMTLGNKNITLKQQLNGLLDSLYSKIVK